MLGARDVEHPGAQYAEFELADFDSAGGGGEAARQETYPLLLCARHALEKDEHCMLPLRARQPSKMPSAFRSPTRSKTRTRTWRFGLFSFRLYELSPLRRNYHVCNMLYFWLYECRPQRPRWVFRSIGHSLNSATSGPGSR